MTDLTIIKQDGGAYIDSREVAEIIGKQHKHLLRDIRSYCEIMGNLVKPNFGLNDFFLESSYVDPIGRTLPSYLISKMGAEVIANKLTGEKGLMFTVAYVTKFNLMEAAERAELEALAAMPAPRLGEYNACARIVTRTMRDLGATPEDMLLFLQELYRPLGITIEADIETDLDDEPQQVRKPRLYTAKQIAEMLGIYSINGNPHPQAVSCILNENLCISDAHRAVATFDCGDYLGISIQYDEYAVKSVRDWLREYGYPSEVYGVDRTYNVRYDR